MPHEIVKKETKHKFAVDAIKPFFLRKKFNNHNMWKMGKTFMRWGETFFVL